MNNYMRAFRNKNFFISCVCLTSILLIPSCKSPEKLEIKPSIKGHKAEKDVNTLRTHNSTIAGNPQVLIEAIKTIHSSNKATSVKFSPDGVTLAIGYETSTTVDLWRTGDWKKQHAIAPENDLATLKTSLSFSPISNSIATGTGAKIRIWNTINGKLTHAIEPVTNSPSLGLYSVGWSSDGKLLATALRNQISLWRTDNWVSIRTIEAPANVSSLEFAFNSRVLVVGCYDFTVMIFDTTTGKSTRILQKGLGPEFIGVSTVVALTPSGTVAAPASIPAAQKIPRRNLAKALANQDQPILLWDSKTGKITRTLKGQPVVRAIAFSPDGSTVATGGIDSLLNLWNVVNGELLHTFKGHEGAINSVSFSPDGKTIATASSDTTVKIWRVPQ